MNQENLQNFETYVQEAIQQTLPEYELTRESAALAQDSVGWSESVLVSIIRFQSASLQGTALIACDMSFLERTCPVPGTSESPDKQLILQDWIGELSNLILGRIKNKLLPLGIVLQLNPPSVTESSYSSFDTYAVHEHNIRLWFRHQQDFVCVGFSLSIADTVQFPVEAGKDGQALQPGDAVYRLNEPLGVPKAYDVVTQIRSGVSIDEESLGHDEFDLLRSAGYRSSLMRPDSAWDAVGGERAEQRAHGQTGLTPADAAAARPQDGNPPQDSNRRALEAISWQSSGELHLVFSGGLTYRLVPEVLVQQGTQQLVVEGYQLELAVSGPSIRVLVPESGLTLVRVQKQPIGAVA